jgi:hypothetical protein
MFCIESGFAEISKVDIVFTRVAMFAGWYCTT